MLELELRGRMTESEYTATKALLERKVAGRPNDKKSQFFEYEAGILKVSYHEQAERTILSLKLGDETRNNLEEIEVELQNGSFANAVALLERLGYPKREFVVQRRTDYTFDGVCISLKHTADWGYHFEAEKLVESEDSEKAARKQLKDICKELNLKPMSPTELARFLKSIKKSPRALPTKAS